MEKVNKRIKELRSKFKFSKIKQVQRIQKLFLQEQCVMCPIDKAANNIVFICKKDAQVLLKELGLLNATSDTYQQVNDTLHKVLQQQNNTLDSVFELKGSDEEFIYLPCIYWLPKIHETPSALYTKVLYDKLLDIYIKL